jgi:hypothetical protein
VTEKKEVKGRLGRAKGTTKDGEVRLKGLLRSSSLQEEVRRKVRGGVGKSRACGQLRLYEVSKSLASPTDPGLPVSGGSSLFTEPPRGGLLRELRGLEDTKRRGC